MNLFELQNVGFAYGSQVVLRNINLNIQQGDFIAIVGPSGSGKSTLLNILGLMALPTEGSLSTFGRTLTSHVANREPNLDSLPKSELISERQLAFLRRLYLGFVFQNFSLMPKLTALQNVLLPYKLAKLALKELERFCNETEYQEILAKITHIESEGLNAWGLHLLSELGVEQYANVLPSQLSGGQKQRVAIARSLCLQPSVLLADEPTGALDSENSKNVLNIFAKLNANGTTVVIITHDLTVAASCAKVCKIHDGQIVSFENNIEFAANGELHSTKHLSSKIQESIRKNTDARKNSSKNLFSRPMSFQTFSTISTWFQFSQASVQRLLSQKFRTFLSALGLIIGVGSIMIVSGASELIQSAFTKVFYTSTTRKSYLYFDDEASQAKGTSFWSGVSRQREFQSLQEMFSKYGNIRPNLWTPICDVQSSSQPARARIASMFDSAEFAELETKLKAGRFPNEIEVTNGSSVALLGSESISAFFAKNYPGRKEKNFPIGEKIVVSNCIPDTVFNVIGVLEPRDTSFGNRDANDRIYISAHTFLKSQPYSTFNSFSVLPNPNTDPRWLADNIKTFLEMKANNKIVMGVRIPSEIIEKIRSFLTVFQFIMSFIGGLCILVGGVGIMNVMLVNVAERTREIGLLKSFGCTPKQIRNFFLLDSLLLCLFGGIIGALLGFVINNILGWGIQFVNPLFASQSLVVAPAGLIVGLTTSIATAIVFGLLPAIRASNMNPAECLREE